jgi:hypothetical protein
VTLVVAVLLLIYFTGRPKVSKDNADAPVETAQSKDSADSSDHGATAEKVSSVSLKARISEAGLKSTPPAKYGFIDTGDKTAPMQSFGLSSKSENQKLMFIIWDGPVGTVDELAHRIPFADLNMVSNLKDVQIARGQVTVAGEDMNWFAGLYKHKFWGGDQLALVGTYRAPRSGKLVVVVAQPYSNTDALDYMKSLSVIQWLANSRIGSR